MGMLAKYVGVRVKYAELPPKQIGSAEAFGGVLEIKYTL